MTANPEYVPNVDETECLPTVKPEYTSSEAPAVVFTQLYKESDGQVVQFNLTIRAETGPEALDKLVESISYGKKKYGLSVVRPQQTLAAAPTANSAPAAPASVPAPQSPTSAPANAGSNTGTVNAAKMEVVPAADGKVTLKWYASGHQFADIYTTRTLEKAVELLAPTGQWTAQHLAAAQTYTVAHKIQFRLSEKTNSRGNPYKDIVGIGL